MFDIDDRVLRNILLVEHDPLLSSEVRGVLTEAGVYDRLHRVAGADDAIAYLRRDAPYYAAPRPNVVVLGEGLRCDEAERVQKEVRRNPSLRQVRVLEIIGEDEAAMPNGAEKVRLTQLGSAISPQDQAY